MKYSKHISNLNGKLASIALLSVITACSGGTELDLRGSGSGLSSSDAGRAGSSAFAPECKVVGGSIGCKVLFRGQPVKLDHPALGEGADNKLPSFYSYLVPNVETSSALSADDSPIVMSSATRASSDYAFIFRFFDESSNIKIIMENIASDENAGNAQQGSILTVDPAKYTPTGSEPLYVKVNKCLYGLVLHSWLNTPDSFSDFAVNGYNAEEYRYQTFIPFNAKMGEIDGEAIPNADKWKKLFEDVASKSVSSECDAYKSAAASGERSEATKTFENELGMLLEDYLMKNHGITATQLKEAKPSENMGI